MSVDMSGYVEVSERIVQFREKYPDGSLQPVNPDEPYTLEVIETDGTTRAFIVYTAAAYRTPDDPRPGIGVAWEPFPGRTNYTRDSELMNAETSAWGRAIIAIGAADAKRGIASADEVRNREAERAAMTPALPYPQGFENRIPTRKNPEYKGMTLADIDKQDDGRGFIVWLSNLTPKDDATKQQRESTEKHKAAALAYLKAEADADEGMTTAELLKQQFPDAEITEEPAA